MAISAVTVAVRAVKSGMSARAGLVAARAAGVQIRDATWFRIVGEVQRSLSNQIQEASAPLNRRPVGAEISELTTKVATGYMQYVNVFVRDKDSGVVSIRPYAVRTATLLTRQAVIARAMTAFQTFTAGPEPSYPEQVLGASYAASYRMTPGLGGGGGGGGGGAPLGGGGVTAAASSTAPVQAGGGRVGAEAGLRSAYAAAPHQPAGWVALRDLRPALDALGISRADQDATMTQMVRSGAAHPIPEEDQKQITPADRAAALNLGGRNYHFILIG